ncbi:hypothetical protein SCLCIDRAFT_270140 [Scleroderma citrinum Foug A]|uniref:Uncharacterized protein n=1 Tax=Scleroderma citrinum Foug A TaxID=1036808 RepID=A0A0C2Z2A8_9AGAM|nr:hypothetical protein SCLCIDRAFT_270140 [Scleroderma citrinum Foug A]
MPWGHGKPQVWSWLGNMFFLRKYRALWFNAPVLPLVHPGPVHLRALVSLILSRPNYVCVYFGTSAQLPVLVNAFKVTTSSFSLAKFFSLGTKGADPKLAALGQTTCIFC